MGLPVLALASLFKQHLVLWPRVAVVLWLFFFSLPGCTEHLKVAVWVGPAEYRDAKNRKWTNVCVSELIYWERQFCFSFALNSNPLLSSVERHSPLSLFVPFPERFPSCGRSSTFSKKKKKKTWIGNRFTVFKPHSDFSEMPGGQSCPLRSPHPSHSPCPHSEITCLLVSFVSFLCVSLCKYNPVFLALFLSPGVHVLHTHSPHCFFHLAVCPEKTGTQWS